MPDKVADAVGELGSVARELSVEVSYEVINLLSTQLYSSPLKAIEELVVNAWDADATTCQIWIPDPAQLAGSLDDCFLAVLDDGHGMDIDEVVDLWHVGVSKKRSDEWKSRASRAQIGKFGIGKLASYAIAKQVTYLTKGVDGILAVTVDFESFSKAEDERSLSEPVKLELRKLEQEDVTADPAILKVTSALGGSALDVLEGESWTLVVLEDLRERAQQLRKGRLIWVLRTAMPLAADFSLSLNNDVIESSKRDYEFVVSFEVSEIDPARLQSIKESTGVEWVVQGESLVSTLFPEGVRGDVGVSSRSLYAESAKSEDLGRSHGFFVRVRNRLINEADPLFGLKPLSFTTFYNFFAEVQADDLDQYIKAPRDDVEQSAAKSQLRFLLSELFKQARDQYEELLRKAEEEEKHKKEGTRDYVNPRLVERPVADALVLHRSHGEVPEEWLYLKADATEESIQALVEALYETPELRRQYTYRYTSRGRNANLVEFDPQDAVFLLNDDHELVVEYSERSGSKRLLEAVATAEALLEIYLRAEQVPAWVIQSVLQRRDQLLRSLATDELHSLRAIAQSLRDAVDDEYDLEVAQVAAVRALGLVAKQISGAGEPDGDARYEARSSVASFTLEAKSSSAVPSLGALDFAGLRSHYEAHHAKGCLLVAPSYPGATKGEKSEVSVRAGQQKVSCWTVEQLAQVVQLAEARRITADEITDIVLTKFTPEEVSVAVENLLSQPTWIQEALYREVLGAVENLEARLPSSRRDVSMIAALVSQRDEFSQTTLDDVRDAVEELSKASRGMLHLAEEDTVVVRGSLDELRRRVSDLVGQEAPPRRRGVFRKRD